MYQTVASQTFPAPDSMLFDPSYKRSIAFEFKPPTETKRGILTGLGQAIAYLQSSSLAYLVVPSKCADGYDLTNYLVKLFDGSIRGKLPLGLIDYEDDEAKQIRLQVDIPDNFAHQLKETPSLKTTRYWAKWVDMPLNGLWIILDLAYQLPLSSDNRIECIWRKFFDEHLFPKDQRTTLEILPSKIIKHDGTPLMFMDKTKKQLKAKVDTGDITEDEALSIIGDKINPDKPGDNYYKSVKKNYLPLIKHLMLWDDQGQLTEDGFQLHKIGKIHGATGKTFMNHFGRIVLTNGKHLDLILDVEEFTRNKEFQTLDAAISALELDFIERGLFKPNRGRLETGKTTFLKYERILWGHLEMLKKQDRSQYIPGRGFLFSWEHLTRLCSLE